MRSALAERVAADPRLPPRKEGRHHAPHGRWWRRWWPVIRVGSTAPISATRPGCIAYSRSFVRDADLAADVVQETFVIAGQRAEQLREPERLLPWLYAIARHECVRQLRTRRREAPAEIDEPAAEPTDPADAVQAAQVRELVHAAIGGLGDRDREILELALRHELATDDMSAVLRISTNHVHARLSRARAALERSLGVLVVARSGSCPELRARLVGWNGCLNPLLRKRLSRHVDRCDRCQGSRGMLLSPSALLGAYVAGPFAAVAAMRPRPVPPEPALDPATGFLARRRRIRFVAAGTAAVAAVAVAVLLLLAQSSAPMARDAASEYPYPPTAPVLDDSPTAATPLAPPPPAASGSGDQQPANAASTPRPDLIDPGGSDPPRPPEPTQRPRPAASARLAAPGSTPPSFSVVGTGRAGCSPDAVSYRLSVSVSASQRLASATLVLRGPGTAVVHTVLTRTATSARGEHANLRYPTVEWRIVARAADGATAQTARQTLTNPCPAR